MASWNGEEENPAKDGYISRVDADDRSENSDLVEGTECLESQENSSKLRNREENPFSFRHFLSRSTTTSSTPTPSVSSNALPHDLSHNLDGGVRAKPRAYNSYVSSSHSQPRGLPDFVQDHLPDPSNNHPPSQLPLSSPLPFDLTRDQPHADHRPEPSVLASIPPLELPAVNLPNLVTRSRSRSPIHAEGDMPIPFDLANCGTPRVELGVVEAAGPDLAAVSIPRNEDQEADGEGLGNGELSLPDFLSDGPMQNGRFGSEFLAPENGFANAEREARHRDLENVFQENEELRSQLESVQVQLRAEREKVARMELALEEQRRREMAETSVMERAVGQIDVNLHVATERAELAESQASSLRVEIRRLESEMRSLRRENELLRGAREPSELRFGVRRTAQELNAAANQAERTVRELLSGVEHLRILAATLESLDSSDEVPWHNPKKPAR